MNQENCKNECGCLSDILRTIIMLQRQNCDNNCSLGCDRPYLGPNMNNISYNTRPVNLYNCCTGTTWTFPYTVGETTGESDVLRVESLDECCCTCRILYPGTTEGTYLSTNQFVTINLDCVGAMQCLTDTFVELG
ncbi:MAG: hypothetical protein E7160_04455 [Firmicutes bacterium]|nr:hypothetical protein [Bacillota bacterium]